MEPRTSSRIQDARVRPPLDPPYNADSHCKGGRGGAAPNTHTSTIRGCLWMAVGRQNRGPPLYVGVCGWLVSTITADLHYLWVFVDGFWSEGLETI